MKCLWDVASECIHLGFFIDSGACGPVGPFLVPFIEWAGPHVERVHFGRSFQLRFCGDEVCLEGCFEVCPRAKIDWGKSEGGSLAISCPFPSRSPMFEVREYGGDFLVYIGVQCVIQIEVVFNTTPEAFGCGAIS